MRRGYVASDPKNNPAKDTENFLAQVIVINHPGEIKNGYTPMINCHACHVACKFDAILRTVDKRAGAVLEEEPKFIKNGDCAIVRMVPTRPMVVEAFSEFPPLGRFAVRDLSRTVAVGVIKSVNKKN